MCFAEISSSRPLVAAAATAGGVVECGRRIPRRGSTPEHSSASVVEAADATNRRRARHDGTPAATTAARGAEARE